MTTDLGARLDYMLTVNRILLSETRVGGTGSVLTPMEMIEQEESYAAGEPAEEFADRLVERDKMAERKAGNMNDDDFNHGDIAARRAMHDAGRGR